MSCHRCRKKRQPQKKHKNQPHTNKTKPATKQHKQKQNQKHEGGSNQWYVDISAIIFILHCLNMHVRRPLPTAGRRVREGQEARGQLQEHADKRQGTETIQKDARPSFGGSQASWFSVASESNIRKQH